MLRIFLSVVERCLREHSPACPVTARIGAVAFIHRFGSSLNEHVHFHCCVIDGVFEPAVALDEAPSVSFHAALGLDAAAFADVQARVRTRVLRTFVRRGLIDNDDATEMRAWAHGGGFSVDGSVRIEGADRTGLERLLRYCARPPFALEHLHQRDAEHLVYRNPKPARGTAPGARPAALVPTPLELITKIAALVPPPRAHRHRYIWCARAQCTATRCGDGAGPCRRCASADFRGGVRGTPSSCRAAISGPCCWRASMKPCH